MGKILISVVLFLLSISQTENNQSHHGRLLASDDDFPFHGRGVIDSGLHCVEIPSASPFPHMGIAGDSSWVQSCCNQHPCPKTSKYIITYILHYISFDDLSSKNTTKIAATSRATFGYGLEGKALSGPYDPSHDLVVSGNVTKKKFSHCLDGRNGFGIAVVGDVVQRNLTTTPLFSNHSSYYVIMKSIEVGKDVLNFSTVVYPVGVSDEVVPVQDGRRTMMDSGTAMAYFPEGIFKKLYKMVMSSQLNSGLETRIVQDNYTCFLFNKRFDLRHGLCGL
ncbi:hypothetical protein MKW98_006427 [Papaver atlanticum]|uniref:Peptidase A1 domain-containing protein n=1 Tax=Papaver atlanticum TaxID=357466 RepID=A0AAD4RVW7_9MAGN|nr:hypothetical protein MKW98_006427 [Papaver atlanticum]